MTEFYLQVNIRVEIVVLSVEAVRAKAVIIMEENKIKFFKAHTPSLEELVTVFQDGLGTYFTDVKVELVDCPDFTQRPYKIAVAGLHGKTAIADVGGGE